MIDLDKKEKYSRRVGALSSDCSVLTASTLDDINQVFYGNGVDSELSATDLSVRYVTADDYHDLIAGTLSDDFEPQTLYVVSSDEINAYNTQVKNVADPVDSKDAANKQWVEDVIGSSLSDAVFDDTDYVKIGKNAVIADSGDIRSIAIGKNAAASNTTYENAQSMAVGADSIATGEASIAIGSQAEAIGTSGSSPTGGLNISIGYRAKAEGKSSIAIGAALGSAGSQSPDSYPYAKRAGSIVIGQNAKALAEKDTVVGTGARGGPDGGTAGTAFGASAIASGAGAVAVGYEAVATGQQSIAIGRNAKVDNKIRAIAIGGGQHSSNNPNDETNANANYAIAIGFGAKASGLRSIAIGGNGAALSTDPISKVTANDAVQIGIGTNSQTSSLQFRDYTIIDSTGKIPVERLSIDDGLLSTSINPVQNKVIASVLNEKASMIDLPYALVTSQQTDDWVFTGSIQDGTVYTLSEPDEVGEGVYVCILSADGESVGTSSAESSANPSSWTFPNVGIVATHPYALLDRAVNAVRVTGMTTLTLPTSAYSDKARDLYVNLDIQNSSQTVTINSNDEDNNPIALLNSSSSFTLSQGHHVIHILEVSQDTFIVSELPMLQ